MVPISPEKQREFVAALKIALIMHDDFTEPKRRPKPQNLDRLTRRRRRLLRNLMECEE